MMTTKVIKIIIEGENHGTIQYFATSSSEITEVQLPRTTSIDGLLATSVFGATCFKLKTIRVPDSYIGTDTGFLKDLFANNFYNNIEISAVTLKTFNRNS